MERVNIRGGIVEEDIKKKMEEILISGKIEENLEFITQNIPEVKSMMGFEHRHPHHHLDVWEHTLEAMKNLESTDLEVRMAVLLHDIGKPFSYQDEEVRHFHGHPEVSAKMSESILRRLSYDEGFIKEVCYLVKMHDTIIDPNDLDNTREMINKRLQVQYADAKAHAPSKVEKRIKFLDDINNKLKSIELDEER